MKIANSVKGVEGEDAVAYDVEGVEKPMKLPIQNLLMQWKEPMQWKECYKLMQ